MNATEWFNRGNYIEINHRKIFVYDSASSNHLNNQSNKPVLVILHGYPTCSYDYYKAIPYLESKFRVIIHDHMGFGYSDKPKDYSYCLIDQAQYALKLWEKLGIHQAHLLAHDYGTSIATEIIALDNENKLDQINLLSVTLCNGSIHIELAKLRLIQKLLLNKISGPIVARLSNKKTLARNLKNIYFDQ
jgi:pimeloyl-ACP methyl ester carboxylesterase